MKKTNDTFSLSLRERAGVRGKSIMLNCLHPNSLPLGEGI